MPYCKFCNEEGHWVRDRSGAVTCPKLKNVSCGYCKKGGHTTKHCPVLKAKKQQRNNERRCMRRNTTDNDGFTTVGKRRNQQKKTFKNKIQPKVNRFETFAQIERIEEVKEQEWPELSAVSSVPETNWESKTNFDVVEDESIFDKVAKIPITDYEEMKKWDRSWPKYFTPPDNLVEWRRINSFTMLGKSSKKQEKIQELKEKLTQVELKPVTNPTAWSDYESDCESITSEISQLENDLASEYYDSEASYVDTYEQCKYPNMSEWDPVLNDCWM